MQNAPAASNIKAHSSDSHYDLYDLAHPIPNTYKDSLAHKDAPKWQEAIERECDALRAAKVFEEHTGPLPNGVIPIHTRHVFKLKQDDTNKIAIWKDRIVVQGFRQREGIDYKETFAPTVKYKSIKLILALAAINDFEIKQLDFDTAFLNASLEEDIYVTCPEGYKAKSKVLKLLKALYGLKQAPREWWLELSAFLATLGYKATALDQCLYYKKIGDQFIYLTLYVDDTLSVFPTSLLSVWNADRAKISPKYAIKDLGDCQWILNTMAVKRDRPNRRLTLSQEAYAEKMLYEFGMQDCKPALTPYSVKDIMHGIEA